MKGIAHLAYPGGGTVLPARSAYERQVLVEHVAHRARRSLVVRLDLDGRRWSVTVDEFANRAECATCRRRVSVSGTNTAVAGSYCLLCVIGLAADEAPPRVVYRRAAG